MKYFLPAGTMAVTAVDDDRSPFAPCTTRKDNYFDEIRTTFLDPETGAEMALVAANGHVLLVRRHLLVELRNENG